MSEYQDTGKEQKSRNLAEYLERFWLVAQVITLDILVYHYLAHIINHAALAVSGGGEITSGTSPTGPLPILFLIIPDKSIHPSIDPFVPCFSLFVLTGIILGVTCGLEWVKTTVNVKKCWDDISWNPWTWVKVATCTFVQVHKWILQKICRIKEGLVWGALVLCIIAVVAALAST